MLYIYIFLLTSWSETEMRGTRRRLSACVRVHGAHFEHEFWQFWADLSRQLIILLNKPYSVYCVLIQSSYTLLQIKHFNVLHRERCFVMRCLCVCVCVSVTFVHCVKTNKRIFKIFSPSGSHIILVFTHQTAWQYSDGNPPNEGVGVECRWDRLKSRNQRLSGLAINNCCTVVCISYLAAGFLFTAGIGRPSAIDALLCTVRDRPSAVSCYTQSRGRESCVW